MEERVEEIERSAASVEEALEAALEELGATEQEVQVKVVREPRSGVFGIGAQEAVIRVRKSVPSQGSSEVAPSEDLEEEADLAGEFVEGLCELLELDVETEPFLSDGVMYLDVWGSKSDESMGLLIGKRGATLDALQELTRAVVQSRTGERSRVIVDVEDYRKRRISQIVSRAQSAAARVKRSGRPEPLEPMTSFERKIVHDAVAAHAGIETASEGEEPYRRVVIRRSSHSR